MFNYGGIDLGDYYGTLSYWLGAIVLGLITTVSMIIFVLVLYTVL